jgi:hypothetical protein
MTIPVLTRRSFVVGALSLLLCGLSVAAPYRTPEQASDSWKGEWRDEARDRQVPVKIYYLAGQGSFPVSANTGPSTGSLRSTFSA